MNAFDTEDLYGKSNREIAAELGARFRAYRIALQLTQKDISEKTGISVMTLVRFENGKASSLSLGHFIALERTIHQLERIAESIPDIPESLYRKKRPAPAQRVRRKKDEKKCS